jgi:hypothetical protein
VRPTARHLRAALALVIALALCSAGYRANADGSWPSTALAAVSSSTLTYPDTGLASGATYTYRGTAYDGAANESAPSGSASAAVVCAPRQSAYSSMITGTSGLLGYWRLGEASGAAACDSMARNNGTFVGGVTPGVAGALAADPDTAAAFDGASGQVNVSASSSLNVGDTFSIEAWVRRARSATGANEVIASKQAGAWVLMFNGADRLTLRRSNVGEVAVASVVTVDTTGWHHVVATKNGPSVHLYLDGADVTGSVTNQTMVNNSQPLAIGQSSSTSYLKGSIDEVALYDTVLTPSQVTQHYEAAVNPAGDPVLATVGDIACPFGDTSNSCQQLATANLVAGQHPAAVAVLGDNQYNSGLLSEYDSPGAYNATWGQFNPIVRPVPGNHEYAASSMAEGYFNYFGSVAANGSYSYDVGAWHVIALNSDCSDSGCADREAGTTTSAQVSWLQADLAAHQQQCTLAYWHHPLFSSGFVGNSPGVAPLWQTLYAAHADVIVNGHDHLYERFAQQDLTQHATSEGIREFVVGTGGESLDNNMGTIQPNMQASELSHFGALFLTLHPGSYDWAFRSTSGAVLDSGSTPCHAGSASAPAAVTPHAASAPAPAPAGGQDSSPSSAASGSSGAVVSSTPAPLVFTVRLLPASLRSASEHGLAVDMHCSRACDVRVTVRVHRGHHLVTVARYRDTETEIPRPFDRVRLKLSRHTIRRLGHARLLLTFVAEDASFEERTVTRTLTLRRH